MHKVGEMEVAGCEVVDSTESWPLAKNLGRAALGAGTTWWHAGTSAPSFGAGGCERWHGGTVARAEEAHDDVHSDRGWTTWTRPRAAALCRLRRVRDGLSLVFCSVLFQIEMNFFTFPLQ